ncbi:MAG: peptide chain release factor N(5)-glutamine methyltransferase [Bacteroidota bacterium]|nr:peptide chain release factor N(5)-glutamine methyltransferase [Bacteroidota bacterium]
MDELYQRLKSELESKLTFLEDKPEETIDSTIKSIWNKAYGISISAKEATKHPLPELSDKQVTLLHQLIEQRINGKPLAYITGRQNFMGVELVCDNRALIPREETEILGRKALWICQKIARKKLKVNVFDVCCGTGNLGLALASLLPDIVVNSSDLSEEAVDITRENIKILKLEQQVSVRKSDLFSNFESEVYNGNVDLIVCNPPYISTSKIAKMDLEISENEPFMAFDGGMVGMKVIQRLICEAPKFLTKGGWVVFEVGEGQGSFIIQICENSQLYKKIEPVTDVSGNIRVIAACCRKGENM